MLQWIMCGVLFFFCVIAGSFIIDVWNTLEADRKARRRLRG